MKHILPFTFIYKHIYKQLPRSVHTLYKSPLYSLHRFSTLKNKNLKIKMAPMKTTINQDDLVYKLREARTEMQERKLFKRVCTKDIWGSDSDSDSDDDFNQPQKRSMTNRNTIQENVWYFNKNLLLGIQSLTDKQMTENNMANILYDLANFPLDMVMDRLTKEGAIIEN